MEIFILRHGHAQAEAQTDALRPLSSEGREQINANISRNRQCFSGLQQALVSPLLRAQQTFAAARAYLPAIEVGESALLAPGGDPLEVIRELHAISKEEVQSILLVSHLPLVGSLIDCLCGSEPGRYRMATGSLAVLDAEVAGVGLASLRWLRHAD